ncbi:uncharacterized protein [Miscanthus floridulus]|uniref:uncharacterized protein isoform X1 n=1 Tax=Miscanthus floridulus TaxID=154761 RepID=UPI00345A2CD0
MASKFDNQNNEQLVDEYCDQDEDGLGDFIVYSDDDEESLKQKQHQQELDDEVEEEEDDEHQQELDDEVEEEEEEEVEDEEEEAPVGQQEILSLREQLKEEIRRKNAAMAAGARKPNLPLSSKNQTMPPVKDGYGTFFGPSKPVLARRVIEEGCSTIMKDLQNVPSKKDVSLALKMRQGAVEKMQKLKFVSEEKRKVDTLRKNRDYSCLFSDDADTQPPTKDHPESSRALLLVPKSETQDAGQVNSARKSRVFTGQPATLSSTDHGLKKGSGSLGKKAHAERKGAIAAGRNGSNLPNLKKKSPGLLSSSKGQELQPSLHNKRPQASIPGQKLRQQPQSQRPQGNGRQPPLQGRSLQGQLIGQNRSAAQNGRLKSAQKQLIPSSKFKHLQASHGVEKHIVKRRKSNDDRQIMHKYDEFAISDEDESDMEADFASIQREERRSAALARKEDQEQLRLIKEEERRERAMKRKRAAQKE